MSDGIIVALISGPAVLVIGFFLNRFDKRGKEALRRVDEVEANQNTALIAPYEKIIERLEKEVSRYERIIDGLQKVVEAERAKNDDLVKMVRVLRRERDDCLLESGSLKAELDKLRNKQ